MEELLGIVTSLTGGFTSLLTSVQSVVGAVLPFVAAFNPALVELFNQAIDGLMATIGSGFAPAIQIATDVVKEMGGILLPVIEQLTPIITQFANIVGDVLVSQLRLLASVVVLLIPFIQIATDVLGSFIKVVDNIRDVATAVVRTISALIGGLNGSDISGWFEKLAKQVQLIISTTAKLIAQLLVIAGAGDAVKEFADQLDKLAKEEEKREEGLKAAAKNAQTGSILEILRKMQESAFIARGTSDAQRTKPDTSFLEGMAKDMRTVAAGQSSFKEIIKDAIKESIPFFKTLIPSDRVLNSVGIDTPQKKGFARGTIAGVLGIPLGLVP